ncbi:phage tail assembly protein [Varunaivibrio sulfuroxidans]|uniref:Tail assembly chaperone E/41/14-like protein n=1 Tax=Varunaivibrio sulfuroxidans TaxID=1773489 RepID=A0A4R3J9N6_9PROT|nr:phage tail assembly protein [Varunaivibrio sulfuroxidans]TCS62588.1 tail assembly chaperone E/41/14-like protein [Varunaivibrio sulfuroxidans]WES30743.1 phage tail assembly protein [Varunaivibrio sulfuroxidans]
MLNDNTVRLQYPIVRTLTGSGGVREENIETVTLRRAKLKDLRGLNLKALETLEGDTLETLIQRLSGLSKVEVGELDLADLEGLSLVIEGFFPKPKS